MDTEDRTSTRVLSTKLLGTIAAIGFAIQPVIVWAFMLIIAPDVAWTEPDSNYALGDLGWLRQVAFMTTGVAAIALALGIRRRFEGKGVRLTTVFLYISGVAQIGTGIFNTDPTTEGSPHDLFALLSLIGLLGTLFAIRGLFARNDAWKSLATPALVAAIWFVVSVAVAITNIVEAGAVQRFVFVPVTAWLVWVSWNIREGRNG